MIPEADSSSLTGMYTVLNLFANVVPNTVRFDARIVAPEPAADGSNAVAYVQSEYVQNKLGLPVPVHNRISDRPNTDVLIIPSLFTDDDGEWHTGRYPGVIEWTKDLYASGKMICSSCTGALLLAETGLLDGREATQHWAFEPTFRRNFPNVKLNAGKVLVTTGDDARIVMSGASAAWHDLVLYLIGKFAGPDAARTIAKFFLLQWHSEGQAPYIEFRENRQHDDVVIRTAQDWLRQNSHRPSPVDAVVQRSGLTERSFNRRFHKATGLTPIGYVQNLRVDAAKRFIETTPISVDEISFKVGYEDPSFFRRVFKRITGMTPSSYRRKFAVVGVKL